MSVRRIANVIIPTRDQEGLTQFFTETLGFELRVELPFGDGRWIEVAPDGAETTIAICPPGPEVTPGGKQTGVTFGVDDVDDFHSYLRGKGVDVDDQVMRFAPDAPPLFWFRDPEANIFMVAPK